MRDEAPDDRTRIVRVKLTTTVLTQALEIAQRQGLSVEDFAYEAIQLAIARGSSL
jgi:hypothetical protein